MKFEEMSPKEIEETHYDIEYSQYPDKCAYCGEMTNYREGHPSNCYNRNYYCSEGCLTAFNMYKCSYREKIDKQYRELMAEIDKSLSRTIMPDKDNWCISIRYLL